MQIFKEIKSVIKKMTTKKCNTCNEEKEFNAFNKNKSGRNGLHNTCKVCRSHIRKALNYERKEEDKLCTSCGEILPSTNLILIKVVQMGYKHTVKSVKQKKRIVVYHNLIRL